MKLKCLNIKDLKA